MRVTAKDRSGKSYQAYVVNPLGHEDNPVSAAELATKFMRLCEPRLGEARAAFALKQWQSIEEVSDVKPAFDALVVGGEPGKRRQTQDVGKPSH
jgi:2-methylcitrate dehydratase PrpD